MLREELGSLLDLVPMVNLADGIPDATVRLVLQGQFLPHIAQLLTTTLLAFKGTNLVEWDVTDPHGRGAFVLTIQRKDGLSAMQLKRQAEERAAEAWTRLYDLLAAVQDAKAAYETDTGTLEQLLDTISATIQQAGQPIGSPLQHIVADITAVVRKENLEDVAPHLLATRVERAFAERSAARTLLDDPMVANAMQRHPILSGLYADYLKLRGPRDNTEAIQIQEDGAAAEARS